MHHPSCWVRNRGCATQEAHEQYPDPVAYTRTRPVVAQPHPAEGTRLRRTAGFVIGATVPDQGPPADPDEDAEAIGDDETGEMVEAVEDEQFETEEEADLPPPPRRYRAPAPEPSRAVRHGRYEPMETVPVRRTLPRVYRRNPLLRYWYVPVAVLLGGAIAAGVVMLADRLLSDDGTSSPAPLPTATPATRTAVSSPSPSPSRAASPAPTTSPSPGATASATARPSATAATPSPSVTGGQFSPGSLVLVAGTGDCLRVREAPTTRAQQLSCLPDGTEASVLSGPADADGFRWWKIRAEGIVEGWVVEDYLRRRP